ncbi:hypothetical protein [Faecalicatena contorta]|uniref:Uncharacterized protein n=1 Tax=Faecalicatena contorta TaxID=39482 RepID=A0A316A461_9FIRM|nr:hypothetical protein [Faecalicatena contorta]PWJ52309.1 hypothetical protein A8805_101484 [Faecalicatena contorta]SUQ12587.1 hypothetical protein SAMN05216529_101484 [Faecalicatena contorta]
MNESEERRRELLRQTRKLYNEDSFIPAIHPRYGHIYHDLYEDDMQDRPKNSFFFRLSLGILCFICYVWMDYGKLNVANVSSDKIVNQIERQTDLKELKEVWKKL